MKKKYSALLALAGVLSLPALVRAQFADGVMFYAPGTGFAANFTNSSTALGAPASNGSVTPFAPPFSNTQLTSIGAGGSLTLQFNTPILNNPANPFGLDFIIFGNSFFVSAGGNATGALFTSSTSTRVEVSADNATWYLLNPLLAPMVGGLFPTDGIGNPLVPVNPALTGSDFSGQNLAGIRALYNGSAGGAGFDLAWAQDGVGNSVNLSVASFIRINVLSGRTQIDAVAVIPEPGTTAFLSLAVALAGVRIALNSKSKTRLNS